MDITSYADKFAALGNESRLVILMLLLRHLPGEMAVGEIQAAMSIPGSTLNHHLERLRREGLVTARRDQQWILYQANEACLEDIQAFIQQDCCSASASR